MVGAFSVGVLDTSASFINGSISFTGSAAISIAGNGDVTVAPNSMRVAGGTLDYATVPLNTLVTANSITFSNPSGDLVSGSAPTWTFTIGTDIYSFQLTTLSSANYAPGASSSIALNGLGHADLSGFSTTAASFGLSGSGNNLVLSFASEQTTAAGGEINPHEVQDVPDGGEIAVMLSVATLCLEALRRKTERSR